MKCSEKGISLIEIIVTIFLISITSILCGICLNAVQNGSNNNIVIEEYLEEKLKLITGLNVMYRYSEENKLKLSYEILDDGFIIYRNDIVIVKYQNNVLYVEEVNMILSFNIIKNIKLYKNDNFLVFTLESNITNEELIMRWYDE